MIREICYYVQAFCEFFVRPVIYAFVTILVFIPILIWTIITESIKILKGTHKW
jgi:hypothetical protein